MVTLVLSMIWRQIGKVTELVRLLRTEGLLWAQAHYIQLVVADDSTLDALLRKVGLLRDAVVNPLAGRMTALLDLCSRLPWHVWYEEEAKAHDQRFWPQILEVVKASSLLIFDLGYTDFSVYAQLTAATVTFITRAKSNLAHNTGE